MRLLIDTNVFLDIALKREPRCESAIKFFLFCRRYSNQTYVTSMSLRDIEYFAHKVLKDKHKANKVISDVYSLCTKVIGISADSAISAIYENYKDFEDELIVQAAKEEMLDGIITNNVKDFANCGVPIFTPDEIVNFYSTDSSIKNVDR